MKLIFALIYGLSIFSQGCSTLSKPSSLSSIKPQEEDVIVKEIEKATRTDQLVASLYETAYEDYVLGKFENAIAAYETAHILAPERMDFWKKQSLSYCYLTTGRYTLAQKLSKELMEEKSDYWGGYFNAGLAALWQNKKSEAIKHLKMASDLEAHEPAVDFYLGITHQLMGKERLAQQSYLRAENAYREIIKNNAEDERAYIELAYLYLYRGYNISRAFEFIQRAEKIIRAASDEIQKRQVWMDFYMPHLKGIYYYRKGDFHKSVVTLSSAIEKAPSGIRLDLAESYYYLGKNFEALKDHKKSKQFFTKARLIDALVPYLNE